MDYPKTKTLDTSLSNLQSIEDLDLLIEDKMRLVKLKEKELALRKTLLMTRVEAEFGISEEGFDSGTFAQGILKYFLRTKPAIADSGWMKSINYGLTFLPYLQRLFKK